MQVVRRQLSVVSGSPTRLRAHNGQWTTDHGRPPGFTLTEVMIAVALVLVLIVGVAQIFQMTSTTVSSGQALQALTRDARAAEATLSNDVQSMVTHTDQPALIIWNQRHAEFLDANHEAGEFAFERAPNDYFEEQRRILTIDSGGTPVRVPPAIYNERNHRVDILGFFTSNFYRRQTPGTTGASLMPLDQTANEAFVWYGHLLTPDAQDVPGTWIGVPGGYARHWILGRQAILLNPDATDSADWQALVDVDRADFRNFIRTSRYDVARGSIRDITARVINQIANNNDWWNQGFLFRLQANPHPEAPFTPEGVAQTTPIFLVNVTSIVVEYAGDFLYQLDKDDWQYGDDPSAWGAPVGTYNSIVGSDGKIDFVYHPAGSSDAVKQIRWYGLPRDVNSDVAGEAGKPDGAIFSTDVIPLRDLWVLADNALVAQGMPSVGRHAPFEREPADVYPGLRGVLNRITEGTTPNNGYANATDGMQPDEAYYCAWGPNDRKPMLIRITLVMHDPQGRLPEGQTFQYVLRVPGS